MVKVLENKIERLVTPKFTSTIEQKVFQRFVEMRAHQLWLQEGCPVGKAEEHWQQAERETVYAWQGVTLLPATKSN
jgi:predicted CoA-binding protein